MPGQEERVAVLEDKLKDYDRQLKGNGQEGIIPRFIILEKGFEDMTDDVKKLATAFSALAKSDSNKEAVRKALGKALVKASIIIGIAGTVVAIIYTLGTK